MRSFHVFYWSVLYGPTVVWLHAWNQRVQGSIVLAVKWRIVILSRRESVEVACMSSHGWLKLYAWYLRRNFKPCQSWNSHDSCSEWTFRKKYVTTPYLGNSSSAMFGPGFTDLFLIWNDHEFTSQVRDMRRFCSDLGSGAESTHSDWTWTPFLRGTTVGENCIESAINHW